MATAVPGRLARPLSLPLSVLAATASTMGPLRLCKHSGMHDCGAKGHTGGPLLVPSVAPLGLHNDGTDMGMLRQQHGQDGQHSGGHLGGGWGVEDGGHVLAASPCALDLTPLMEAVCSNSIEEAMALLEDPDEACGVNCFCGPSGESALQLACELGHGQLVALLLDHQADPTLVNGSGWTPLMHAAMQGHEDVAAQLVAWAHAQGGDMVGVVVDALDVQGESALWKACVAGHAHVAQVLLVQGQADASLAATMLDGTTLTPAQIAAQQGHDDILSLLQWWEQESVERVYVLAKARALSSAAHHVNTHVNVQNLSLPAPLSRRMTLGEVLPSLEGEDLVEAVRGEWEGGEVSGLAGGEVSATVAFVTGGGMSHELYTELLQGLGW